MAEAYKIGEESKADVNLNPFSYILTEEAAYKSPIGVPVAENWNWSMAEHILKSTLYKFGQLKDGNPGNLKPVKNIVWPILNVAYRSEGFDVKDISPFVNDEQNYHKSFLVRKFHPKWARKYSIDTFIDEVVESSVDFDLALVKNVNEERPEAVPLASIAFCDQTDVLSGAICLKHGYSVDQLKDMVEQGWYEDEIDRAILNAQAEKATKEEGQTAKTPSKNIDVYELHGVFPETWLDEDGDSNKYSRQVHIVTYIKGSGDEKNGVCLFKGKSKQVFKALVVNKIYGRACGYGGVEALFQAQIWTNYTMIQMKELLDNASMLLLQTADPSYKGGKKLSDLSKGEILDHKEGMPLTQISITPQNFQLFDNFLVKLEEHARITGSANEAQLGITPTSGTPLGTTQIVTGQGMGIHEFRKGKIATFLTEIYRDWVLPYLVKEMNRGDKWIDELSLDEMQWVAERVAVNTSNKRIKEMVLSGKMVSKEEQAVMMELIKADFKKGGNKRFLEAVKDELKGLPTDVEIDIAGKNKNLSRLTDQIFSVFRFIFSNPQGFAQAMQVPGLQKQWNEILEFSGLSQADFSVMPEMQPQQGAVPSPIQPQDLTAKPTVV